MYHLVYRPLMIWTLSMLLLAACAPADQPAQPDRTESERALSAYAAHYEGLAQAYARQALERGRNADAARWTGLAATYTSEARARQASTARYAGLAQLYAQMAWAADAARWTGLAQTYAKMEP